MQLWWETDVPGTFEEIIHFVTIPNRELNIVSCTEVALLEDGSVAVTQAALAANTLQAESD